MKYIILLTSLLVVISCKSKLTPNVDTAIPMEINSKQLTDMIDKGQNMLLLDVRTPEEVADGKISDALEIDFYGDNFEAEIDKLDKGKHYVVYCRSGVRSSNSVAIMKEKGLSKCTNLKGGYNAWSSQ